MAERLYTTEGIVLKRRSLGEADLLISFFTKELGLVHALGKSARREDSKLRFSIAPLGSGVFTFAPGATYRLTGAFAEDHPPLSAASSALLAKVATLLMRLLPQGVPHEALFRSIHSGFHCVRAEAHRHDIIARVECAMVLRTLHALGYLPQQEVLVPYLEGALTRARLEELGAPRADIIRTINSSLSATGL